MKLLVRHLFKNRGYTVINVMGLSLGIMCSIVLFLMVAYSTGIDGYHRNKERIFCVVSDSDMNGREDHNSGVPVH